MTNNLPDPELDKVLESSAGISLKILQGRLKEKRQVEVALHPELAAFKGRPDFESLLEVCELKKDLLFRGSTKIFSAEFLSFVKNGGAIILIFLPLFFLIHFYKSSLAGYQSQAYLLMTWIFFCCLRANYLAIISNYFSYNRPLNPLKYCFKKLVSFILIEVLQIVILLLGVIVIPLFPFLGAKYSLALPAMISQNEKAVNSLFESREYVRGQTLKVINLIFYSNFTLIFATIFLIVLLSYLIKSLIIFWALIFLIFSFVILPMQAAYRFLLYKKLQKITGEFKFEADLREKIYFVIWRMALLALVVAGVWAVVNSGFGEVALDKAILFFQKFVS